MRRRRPRREPVRWENDWRNPDMKVLRTVFEEGPFGELRKITAEVSAEESSAMCRDSLQTSTAPTWDRDKTYF